MGNVPEEGPVLLVGNHTGGNMAPEVIVLPLAFSTYFGVERPFYQLAHNLVLASPLGPFLRRYGAMAASHEHAKRALRSGAAVLVFPGGDWEVHRPELGGQQGRPRRPQGVHQAGARRGRADRPGGHDRRPGDGALPQPRRLAREADRGPTASLRLKVLPDLARAPLGSQRRRPARPHSAARRRSRSRSWRRSTSASSSAPSRTSTRSTTTSPGVMQEALDGLAAERRFPVIG